MNPNLIKWPLYTIGLVPIFFFLHLAQQHLIPTKEKEVHHEMSKNNMSADSLVLVELYHFTNGFNWKDKTNWLVSGQKLGTWFGIEAGFDDLVEIIKLDEEGITPTSSCVNFNTPGNGLSGTFPPSLCLPTIKCLAISKHNTNLIGSIPDLSCSTELTQLNLSHNDLSGPIPTSLFQVQTLQGIFFQSNRLSGNIPTEMLEELNNLESLNLSDNNFTGLVPDASIIPTLTSFHINRNAFTFEDILPYYDSILAKGTVDFLIHDQDSVYSDTSLNTAIDYPFIIDLLIDDTVSSNSYKWTLDGMYYDSIVGKNELVFETINTNHAGVFHCAITNSKIPPTLSDPMPGPNLTLHSRGIMVNPCQAGISEIKQVNLCPDSIIHIQYAPLNIDTIFNIDNPKGWIRLDDVASNGCDSIIEVDLSYQMEGNITATICEGDSFIIEIANTSIMATGIYDFNIPGGSSIGCDSIIKLDLTVADANTFGEAEAGMDQIVCINEATLQAQLPNPTIGQWKVINNSTAQILDATDPNGDIIELPKGETLLEWSLAYDNCSPFSSDSVSIYYEPPILAQNNTFAVEEGSLFEGNVVLNDSLEFIREWVTELVQEPQLGQLNFKADGTFSYTSEINRFGLDSFVYNIINPNCSSVSNVVVYLKLIIKTDDTAIPNVITPNFDGFNDSFIIPCIHQRQVDCIKNKIVIFNRWGGKVFSMENYDNRWNGDGLPQGTYYYFFDYGEALRQQEKGAVSIVYDQN